MSERALEREIEHLESLYERGEIDRATLNREIRELERDYRREAEEVAEEAAREAYERALDNW